MNTAKRPRSRDWEEKDAGMVAASRADADYVVDVLVFERRGVRVISELATAGPFGETLTWHVSVSEQTRKGPRLPRWQTMQMVRKEFDIVGAEEKDWGIKGLRSRHLYMAVDAARRSS